MTGAKRSVIEELGLEELPEKEREGVLARMAESALKTITTNLLKELSDDDMKKFEEISEKKSPEEIDSFLRSKISNYDEIVENTIKEFKNNIKESINGLRELLQQHGKI